MSCQSEVATAGSPANRRQLIVATGGAEGSCYRCMLPFGVVILIIGTAVTAVAYRFNTHGSTISILGLVLLAGGLMLLGFSVACWRIRRSKKTKRHWPSQTDLMENDKTSCN